MNTISNTKIRETDVNWNDLEGIGIHKEELECNGDLERLLNGEQVSIISLHLTLLGDNSLIMLFLPPICFHQAFQV